MTIDSDVGDVALQPSLPAGLPEFEGLIPVGVVTRLNGAGERITRALHYGDRVVLLVEAEVTNVGHGKTSQGMKRIHTLTALDLYELEGRAGRRILNAAKQSYRLADDQRHGKIPDLLKEHAAGAGWRITPDGYVDASGRLILPEELAEIQGVQYEVAANDESLDVVALVFADGSRAMWPDDYPPGVSSDRPRAGEFVGDLQVREVLDGMSGEPLDVWTDEQEDARLAELEAAALAEEAAGNAEAFAEIQAGRGLAPDGSPLVRDDPFVGLPGDDGKEIGPVESEPLDRYEKLTVGDVKKRVAEMTDRDAVFAVASWEEDHGGRKSILEACGRRAAELIESAE